MSLEPLYESLCWELGFAPLPFPEDDEPEDVAA